MSRCTCSLSPSRLAADPACPVHGDAALHVILIARCPEHGLHGEREECHVCGGRVEQVPMVPLSDLTEEWCVARIVPGDAGGPPDPITYWTRHEIIASAMWDVLAPQAVALNMPFRYVLVRRLQSGIELVDGDGLAEAGPEHRGPERELAELRAWARQVTDAIDGRPLPEHPDRVPAQVAYVRSVWAAALPLLAALSDFLGVRDLEGDPLFDKLREAATRFHRAYAADPLDPAPPPIIPWMMLAVFADALRATGWNDSGGPCWCLRAQEETGEPHRPACARARALLGLEPGA